MKRGDAMGQDPKKLIERARGGDQGAFSLLYNLYYSPVWRYIYLRTKSRSDADDMAQVVFMKAYGSISRFHSTASSPLAYFFTIARNTVIDHYRRGGKVVYNDEAVGHAADTKADPHDIVEENENKELVTTALGQLTKEQEEVIVLKFINELSTKEISEITGKSEEAIRQLQSRGLKQIRTYFKKENLML